MTQVNVRAPGLYLRGRESEPAAALSPAVTGFVGVAQRGPLHAPQRLRSWGEYVQVFGGFVDYGYLAESVYGFFLNGGEACHVVRTGDTRDRSGEVGDESSPLVLPLATAFSSVLDQDATQIIAIEAINPGSWGNALTVEVGPESTHDVALATLTAAADGSSTISVDSIADLRVGAVIRIADAVNGFLKPSYEIQSITGTQVTLTSNADGRLSKGSVVYGRGFQLAVTLADAFQEQIERFDDLSLSPRNDRYFENVVNGDAGITDYVDRQRLGYSILIRVTDLVAGAEPKPDAFTVGAFEGGADGFTQARATMVDAIPQDSITVVARTALGRAGNGLRVEAEPFRTLAALSVESGTDRVVVEQVDGFMTGETITIADAAGVAPNADRTLLSIEPDNALVLDAILNDPYAVGSTVSVADRFTLSVFASGAAEPSQRYFNLAVDTVSVAVGAEGGPISVVPPDLPVTIDPPVGSVVLEGGRCPGEVDHRFYTGYDANGTSFAAPGIDAGTLAGLAAFEMVDDVGLVTIPDLDWATADGGDPADPTDEFLAGQQDLLHHCSKMGERFALLDPPGPMTLEDLSLDQIALWPANFSDLRFTKFGALYYPWVDGIFLDETRRVPPSGLIAGVMARSDRATGVNAAPANLVVRGAVDLAASLDRAEQDELNPAGVNCLRKLAEGSIRVFGARTLSIDLSARYVNVRRVLLHVVKILGRQLRWAAFEPNDERLWRRIETSVTTMLATVVSRGLTASPSPDASFYVKCDAETNPPEIVEAGQVVTEVGLALIAPAEFIVITVRQTPSSLNVIEEDI